MKIGLQINRFDFPGGKEEISSNLVNIAQQAEAAGFDSLWVMDHFFQIHWVSGSYQDPMLEAYTTLGYLAAVTKKVKLGTLVSGVIYREPALLIKAVTALDVLSGGRAYLGIGASWYEEEARALGFLPPLGSGRFERLEETLKIAKQMWSKNNKPFHGKYYRLEETLNEPSPISKPHPPILIGGSGEKKTLRLVAKYADACNLFDTPEASHKLEVLKKHCREIGRNYDEIEKTILGIGRITEVSANAAESLEHIRELKELGFQHLIFSVESKLTENDFDKFSERIIRKIR